MEVTRRVRRARIQPSFLDQGDCAMTPSSPSTHPGSVATNAWRREAREPDAAQIIATFADVERDNLGTGDG
jgi:hypothetical protein